MYDLGGRKSTGLDCSQSLMVQVTSHKTDDGPFWVIVLSFQSSILHQYRLLHILELQLVKCIFLTTVLIVFRHAWDMAAEICLSQLPTLLSDQNAEFQVLL